MNGLEVARRRLRRDFPVDPAIPAEMRALLDRLDREGEAKGRGRRG